MDKKIIEQASDHYVSCRVHETKGNMPAGYAGGIHEGFKAGAEFALPKWILVSERLPEKNTKNYGAHVLATDGKNIFTCTYTTGGEIDIETESDDEDAYDFDEKRGMIFLKAGWYELQEQSHHPDCDEAWYERSPTHWMPLPSLPKPE